MTAALSQRPQSPQKVGGDLYPHLQDFNPNQRTLTWERLENKRLNSLGLGAKRYSRHFQRFQREPSSVMADPVAKVIGKPEKTKDGKYIIMIGDEKVYVNSLAPFYTEEKPTCGFFFSRGTDNKKKKFGIPPSDLVKWRSFVQN